MPARLRKPQQALGRYLDEMLHQATTETDEKATIDRRLPLLLPKELLPAKPEADSPAQAEIEPAASEKQETTVAAEPPQAQVDTEFPMQALMFRVGGHLLAVPLIQLCSVVSWNDSITRLPESPDWLLGLIKHRQVNLRIVDSQLLLDINSEAEVKPEHLLVLGEGGWAITCDHLEQVVDLEYDDVQWKSGDDQKLMLGTIRDSLSTLLNPPGITRLLDQRDSAAPGS